MSQRVRYGSYRASPGFGEQKVMSLPKVSCILPTGYGEKYVYGAIKCFLDQTYPGELELVVVDNNIAPIKHLLPEDPRINYVRFHCMPKSVGALRNIGTVYATGEVCITVDEDDWSHPSRVAQQVERLLSSNQAVTGWDSLLFWGGEAEEGD